MTRLLTKEYVPSSELIHQAIFALHTAKTTAFTSGKEFVYDHVMMDKVVPINRGTDTRINMKVNTQRRSMKSILLLFVVPYAAGTRDSEKYIFPDLKKISVTINGSPNMLYNNGIESRDIWSEASRFFHERKIQAPAHDLGKVLHQ